MKRNPPEPKSEQIALYVSTYYSLLRSTGEVRVRAFEEAHSFSGSSLHLNALSDVPDLSAFAYAAGRLPDEMLDVELLIELRAALADELAAAGKADWAAQEFEYERTRPPRPAMR